MLTNALGTNLRGFAALLAAGSAAGVVVVAGLFFSYAIGAGYVGYLPTPTNLLAAAAILAATVVATVAIVRRGVRYHTYERR